jgi:two-component system sensor histidine kinase TctE
MSAKLASSGSLRNRLVLSLTGGASILALLLFFAVRNYATQIAQQGQDNILNASATSILDTATFRGGEVEVDFPYAALSMLNTTSDDHVFYAIYRDATFLSGYKDLTPSKQTSERISVYETSEFQNQTVRSVTAHRTLIGANQRIQIRVVLAQTQDALSGTLTQISRNAAVLGASFFALATLLSVWATSSTIGQLQRLTQSVTKRGPQDLSAFQKPVPTEMLPLVTSLNSLIGRLDQSLRQSEDFIAEAAHRVRTPLATVRSYAEATLQRVTNEENRQAVRSMIRAIDESSRAAGQLLDHAMITFRADHLERQDIELVELVQELTTRLIPIAEMKDLSLHLIGDDKVPYSGDPILIQNAVRNILDNALKYSPEDTEIEIKVIGSPNPQIITSDGGPGFPIEDQHSLTNRFARGRNAEGTIGSGLGLTIAQDVARAHGGTITLKNNKKGGACVTLSL